MPSKMSASDDNVACLAACFGACLNLLTAVWYAGRSLTSVDAVAALSAGFSVLRLHPCFTDRKPQSLKLKIRICLVVCIANAESQILSSEHCVPFCASRTRGRRSSHMLPSFHYTGCVVWHSNLVYQDPKDSKTEYLWIGIALQMFLTTEFMAHLLPARRRYPRWQEDASYGPCIPTQKARRLGGLCTAWSPSQRRGIWYHRSLLWTPRVPFFAPIWPVQLEFWPELLGFLPEYHKDKTRWCGLEYSPGVAARLWTMKHSW